MSKNLGLLSQSQLTLIEAAAMLPGRPHINSVRRWCSHGIDGIKLRSWRIGGKRCTSREALELFIAETSANHPADAPRMRSASHLAAEAKLDAMGIR